MRSLLFLPAIALGGGTAAAQDGEADPFVLARAIDKAPSAELVSLVAENAATTRFDPALRPELAQMTLKEAIAANCGSAQPGYEDAIAKNNPGTELRREAPLGEQAYALQWPACLYFAEGQPIVHQIRPKDTLTGIKYKYTGSGVYSRKALEDFYRGSGVTLADEHQLEAGKSITLAHASSPTLLIAIGLPPSVLASQINAIGGADVSATVETAGAIIGPVKFRANEGDIGALQGSFEPCLGDESPRYPFDAAEIDHAYWWTRASLKQSTSRITAVVIDNGFFGVPCTSVPDACPPKINDQFATSPRFPRKIFDTMQFDQSSGFGPVLSGAPISPINYWNRKPDNSSFTPADVNVETGHGTHVAGLVLGGPRFEPYRRAFDGEIGKSWLTLAIGNLANGRSILVAGTDRSLADMLETIEGRKIVNMSVAFNARPGSKIATTIRNAIVDDADALFVVAAGNDGGNLARDDLNLYPAGLGGEGTNVITVASLDAAPDGGMGQLSAFSNRNKDRVDIAAPGCRLKSWLNAERDPEEASGTSQATPIVSFGATLLASMWQTSPEKLKNRLLYSGDLLANANDRSVIRSQSSLNIAKALTFGFDRITFRENGQLRTLLGKARTLPTFSCDASLIEPVFFKAMKRAATGELMIFRVRGADELLLCAGSMTEGSSIDFAASGEIKDGAIGPPAPLAAPIRASEVDEIIRAR